MSDTPHINPLGIPLLKVGRDVHGRFRPNNPGGPGNPFARKVAALRKALIDSVSEQDLKDMAEALKLKARQGDTAAIKLLWQYCVGKPAPPKDPDRMDIDEWHRLRLMRVGEKEFHKTVESFPACLACDRAETHWPCNAQEGPLAEHIHSVHCQMKGVPPRPLAFSPEAGAVEEDQTPPAQADPPATEPGEPRTDAPPRPQPEAASLSETPATPTAEPKAQGEPPAQPAAPRAVSAKGKRKSSARREPAGPSKDESPSATQPPLPNGGNEQERQKALERLYQLRRSQPSGQDQRKPPAN